MSKSINLREALSKILDDAFTMGGSPNPEDYQTLKPGMLKKANTLYLSAIPDEWVQKLETTEDEITWCLTCEQILNNDGECWCQPHNACIEQFKLNIGGDE